ncbi:UvrD-helicase domain-containing protein [Paenibacillus sp. FSL K6-2524]|uniref:UvrD-helicase domain-containing protein n=1 Tax=Paenibacillus sp. FSL K6-2524 TaxID=2954516 RepID=UPI0030FBF295
MLNLLEVQMVVTSGLCGKLQKLMDDFARQRFNISNEQVLSLKNNRDYTYYSNNVPYSLNPLLQSFFQTVQSELNTNNQYAKILSLFSSQKVKYLTLYSTIDATMEELNHEIAVQTQRAASFLLEIATIRRGFFTYSTFVHLMAEYQDTFKYFHSGDISRISESTKVSLTYYDDLMQYRAIWNKEYIEQELQESHDLLSNIDGKSLDPQQRIAVVTDEDSNLVLAGAGSGKTLTIAAKVKYLVERKQVKSEDILLISFTNKSALVMQDRINDRLHLPVTAKTFHALGLEIIAKVNQAKPDIFDSKQMSNVIQNYMKNHIFEHGQQIRYLIEFFGYYLSIPKDYSEFENLGEYHEFNRNLDFETLKGKMSKAEYSDLAAGQNRTQLKTLAGETVKSFEETLIANFLFLNSVDYEYEREYSLDTRTEYYRQYKPDFYLPDYDLYIEHFGVDEEGGTPWLSEIEEVKYVEGMKWKRQQHMAQGTTLIETYSYYNKQGILLDKLREKLLVKGVKFQEADYSNIFNRVYQQDQDKYFKEFVSLLSTFINLFKSNGNQETQFDVFMEQNKTKPEIPFIKRRTELFLSLVRPIYNYYEDHLQRMHSIDFTDMINQATDIIRKHQLHFPYRYIIIDEYQDISKSRFGLIQAIRERTNAKVMCVGDDWQSIFRFAGSDLQLFTHFGDYFGAFELMKIEQTYRNSQQLVDVAGRFVMRNQAQLKKKLKSSHKNTLPIQILGYQKDKITALRAAIEQIVKDHGKAAEILLLGRTNFDINFLDEEPEFQCNKNKDYIVYTKYRELEISFLTVHKSKGLEKDHVILLNGENSLVGFPNQIADDPVLSWVLTDQDRFSFAEERRLFYVALTRTLNSCYILTSEQKMSVFLKELIEKDKVPYQLVTHEGSISENPKCPKCKTGHLTRRLGNKTFLGCTNYPGCDYTNSYVEILKKTKPCPKCGGYLVYKKGSRGPFYGCTNYKHNCRYTENYHFSK